MFRPFFYQKICVHLRFYLRHLRAKTCRMEKMNEISEADRQEIKRLANISIHNLNLLIEVCDSWLSDEEMVEKLKQERAKWGWWKRMKWKLAGGDY